jgi:hypothetical protein
MAMGKRRKATPRALVVVSDLHCGCQLGLCPPKGVTLDEGGQYTPNIVQQQLWTWWREFWDCEVPVITRREPYDILLNGDWIDNEHHGTKTLVSNNIETQRHIGMAVMGPEVERCQKRGGRFYVVRGTEAHDGGSGQDVEALARQLGAIPDDTGRHSRWELWKRIEGPQEHSLVHALHHIGGTGGSHYDTSAPKRELIEEFVEAARSRDEPPSFVVRSHRHRYTVVEELTDWGRARCIVTPAWQGKTALAHKIAGARVTPPQFGAIVLRNGDEEVYHRLFWKRLKRSRVEV